MSLQDRIERQMTFPASRHEVWAGESRNESEGGWDEELGHLRNYLLGQAVAP